MTYDTIWRDLTEIYPEGEARAVARYLLEVGFGFTSTDIYCDKITQLSSEEKTKLSKMLQRLKLGEPVQYVTGKSDFGGRQFDVGEGVLIPRPETAELCKMIIADGGRDILDIGTGSGCIAITLALDIPNSNVTAWDISETAIDIARGNAERLGAKVNIIKNNALKPRNDIAKWDVVVSNPPYICNKERTLMERNVLDYEPYIALFVPDNDPLLFYSAIASYAASALKPGGRLYFEINSLYAEETSTMLAAKRYTNIKTHYDMFGNKRFVTAVKKK